MDYNGELNKKEKIVPSKFINNLSRIKSDYFLKKLFLNIAKRRILNIIKYNKLSQNRLNININDYDNYYHTYTPIEIELTIAEERFGMFINTLNFRSENNKNCNRL